MAAAPWRDSYTQVWNYTPDMSANRVSDDSTLGESFAQVRNQTLEPTRSPMQHLGPVRHTNGANEISDDRIFAAVVRALGTLTAEVRRG